MLRLNTNGTVDTTFAGGTGLANGAVYSVALQADGKVVIAGAGGRKGAAVLKIKG